MISSEGRRSQRSERIQKSQRNQQNQQNQENLTDQMAQTEAGRCPTAFTAQHLERVQSKNLCRVTGDFF